MAFAYTARAWQLNDLPSATAKYVFLCLADTANPDGYCWPKLATIAAKVQLSVRTVQRQLHALEQVGVLRREARYHRKYARVNISNGYWLNLGFAADADAVPAPATAPKPSPSAPPMPATSPVFAPLPELEPTPALAQPPVTLSPPACQVVTLPVTPSHPFEPAIEPVTNEPVAAATHATTFAPAPAHVDAPAYEAQPQPVALVAPPVAAAVSSASLASADITAAETTTSETQPTNTPGSLGADPLADVAPDVLAAFNQVRKAKRQPLLNRFVAQQLLQEATRAGLTLTQALTECVNRHWARFKADWLHAYAAPANAAKATSASASTHASTASPAPRPAALDPHTPEGQQWLQTSFRAQQQALQALPRFTGEDAWAHTAIEKRRRGLQVSQHILQAACQLLRLCPRTLQTL